jgi:hypothetical protein
MITRMPQLALAGNISHHCKSWSTHETGEAKKVPASITVFSTFKDISKELRTHSQF